MNSEFRFSRVFFPKNLLQNVKRRNKKQEMAFPKIDGYVVTEKLGSGSYSTVYKAYTKVGARSVVAIKCVDKSRIKHSGSAVDNLITEIRLLKTLTHPHIVQMHNFTWDDKNIYIIMEYCCGGDLSKYIHKYGRIPEHRVLYFLQQLASALKFLREKGVVHMDLKPHNLLLHKGSDGKYILKVADFGFAAHLTNSSTSGVRGSPLYMAPEMLHCSTHDARVDLWSVGVIMYECLFGRAPYSSNTFKELLDKIEKRAPIQIPPTAAITPGCRDLLTRLLQHDPDQRISYEEFFNNEYLDLEHIPTRENYEKAVSLIKLAIELDCAGDLSSALAMYTESLRYLVPVARAQAQSGGGALSLKIKTYMERAEEIKHYIKYGHTAAQLPQNICGNSTTVGGYGTSPASTHHVVTNSNSGLNIDNTRNQISSEKEMEVVNGTVEEPVVNDEPSPMAAAPPPPKSGSRLRRLLSRGMSPLPSLPAHLPTDDNSEDSNKKNRTEGDACRIT